MMPRKIETMDDLEAFIEFYAGPRLPEYGLSEEELPVWLPQPLRRLHLFAGNWPAPNPAPGHTNGKVPRLFQAQDVLLAVTQMKRSSDEKWLEFYSENQTCWSCRTSCASPRNLQTDPPVQSNSEALFHSHLSNYIEVCPSLSGFLITACLHELVFGSRYLFNLLPERAVPLWLLESERIPLWINKEYAYLNTPYSFFWVKGALLLETQEENWLSFNAPPAEFPLDKASIR